MTTHDAPTLELLLRHQSLVRSIARDLLVDPDAADDVVQQTWIAALRHAARGVEVGRSLLARIATNLAFNRRRDERRRETRERHAANAEPLPSVAELVEREDERRRVVEAVFALHEPLRETVLRRYLDDRSEADVAAVLGIPLGTVRSRLRLARTILRERLGKDSDAPRSARGLAALAGWSADEAAAAIASGKGMLVMGAKAWVGVAAGVAVMSWVAVVAWQTARSEAEPPQSVQTAANHDSNPRDAHAETSEYAASSLADRSLVAVEPVAAATAAIPTIVTVRGRCVTPERTPIVGARITTREFIETTTSDASGRFTLAVGTTRPGSVSTRKPDSVSVVVAMPGRVRTSKSAGIAKSKSIELGEFVMPIGASIRGRVLDESDRSVTATVELRPGTATDVLWEFGLVSGTTFVETFAGASKSDALVNADEAGAFAFEGIHESWYSVVALHPDFVCVEPAPVSVAAGATSDVIVRVRPVRDDERIRGRVLDAQGQPVPNADVTWDLEIKRGPTGIHSSGRQIPVDSAGMFTVFGCAGSEHRFTATLPAGAVATVDGVHGGDPEVILRFESSPTAVISVVDADDGKPCEFVAIHAYARDRSASRRASTNSAGLANIELPAHEFMLQVTRRGCDRIELGPFPGGIDPKLAPIRVPRKPVLRGRVSGCDESLAAGARVDLFTVPTRLVISQRGGFPTLNAHSMSSAIVNADGAFELSIGRIAPESSRCFARVEIAGFAPAQTELPLPDPLVASPITLTVTAGGSIEGHVSAPDPRSPAGLVVIAGNDDGDLTSTRVGEDGSYRLEHLRPGMWRIAVAIDEPPDMHWTDDRSFPASDIRVTEGLATHLDLSFLPAGIVALNGAIRLGGNAHIGTRVSLRSKTLQPPKGSSFVFDPNEVARTDATPSGVFTLEAEAPGAFTLVVTIAAFEDEVRIERAIDLVAGSNHVTIDPACGIVTGTCGHPSKWGVSARGTLADGTDVRIRAAVAADGSFTMPRVPAGRYRFSAAADSKEVDVRAGETTTIDLK